MEKIFFQTVANRKGSSAFFWRQHHDKPFCRFYESFPFYGPSPDQNDTWQTVLRHRLCTFKLQRQAMKKTVVLGASNNPSRYSYLAINRLRAYRHPVLAVGKRTGQ